jgi:hypothetical protein
MAIRIPFSSRFSFPSCSGAGIARLLPAGLALTLGACAMLPSQTPPGTSVAAPAGSGPTAPAASTTQVMSSTEGAVLSQKGTVNGLGVGSITVALDDGGDVTVELGAGEKVGLGQRVTIITREGRSRLAPL